MVLRSLVQLNNDIFKLSLRLAWLRFVHPRQLYITPIVGRKAVSLNCRGVVAQSFDYLIQAIKQKWSSTYNVEDHFN
jgi:hypothetical protein